MRDLTSPAPKNPANINSSWQERLLRAAHWAWQRPWLALPVLALPALWPFLELGLPHSADGALHLLRVVALDHHVRQGMLYPRWSPELFTGLGYPVFNFYGPFSYYIAELLHILGLDFVAALMAAFALLVLASGLGMYCLARDVLGSDQRWAALVAATAYMYAPYLLTNVFIRGALAEVGAQAWLPWVFWSARRLLTVSKPAQYVLPLALSLGGLAITHNITLLFTPLALAAYILVLWRQSRWSRLRLAWAAVGIAAAMGVSAFFWLPMIGERQLLAQGAYETAAVFMSENVWTWRNFLDTSFAFDHTFAIPFQLGLVQVALALVGLIAVRRRDAEWLYFLALAVLAGLGISAWSLPLWLSSDTLMIVQFTWRLLALLGIPLALFTGAILVRFRRDQTRFVGACVLLALIILANRPQVGWMPSLATAGDRVALPAIAQYEYETGAMGTAATHEFRPRWNDANAYKPAGDNLSVDDEQIRISLANAYELRIAVTGSPGGPLLWTSLYYPAWEVTLADDKALPTYPSTNLGLLTVDLPPGDHELHLRWAGTDLQRLATGLSLITLALLVGLTWRVNRPRWLAAIPLGLLIFGLTATLKQPSLAAVQSPSQPVTSPSMQMLGYRLEQDGPELYIYPYWFTRQTPSANTVIRWRLLNKTGEVVSETTARPYFNSQEASNWPPATLVDDAYQLAAPPGPAAGSYELAVQIVEDDNATAWASLGDVTIASSVPSPSPPAHVLERVRFDKQVDLIGYEIRHNGQTTDTASPRPMVAQPGDSLEYTLFWQAIQPLQKNYHSLIHLVNLQGAPLVKRDQVAGSILRTPMSWDTATVQPDRYALRIPQEAQSGLYWPMVGLYDFATVELLPIEDDAGQPLGATYRLPPIKVQGTNSTAEPQQPVSAQLGDLATLLGYDLILPATGVRAGSQFSLTLYYRVDATTGQDFTQFLHLYNPDLGMAAQRDTPPQEGSNPTWTWVPGEIIVDTVILRVGEDAMPGEYRLMVGLYNPIDGARLPVKDAHKRVLPDGQISLASLTVSP